MIEFFPSHDEAEQALRDALTDEPDWEGELGVAAVEFGSYLHRQ